MNNEKLRIKEFFICLIAGLFLFYVFIQMTLFSSLGTYFSIIFHLTGTETANLSAAFFYGNMLFQLPAGVIVDKYPARKLLIFAGAIFVISAFLIAMTDSFVVILAARFIMGAAAAISFIAMIKTVVLWTPVNRLATMLGLIIAEGMAGGVVQTPLSVFYILQGGKTTLFVNAYIACFILLLAFIFLKDKKTEIKENKISIITAFRCTANKETFLGAGYIFVMDAFPITFGAMWGTLFLEKVYKLKLIESSSIISVVFISRIIGSFVLGYLSDRFKTRKAIMFICALCSALSISIIIFMSVPILLLYVLFSFVGFFTAATSLGYTVVSEANKNYTGVANSVAGMIAMGVGFIQPLLGKILECFSAAQNEHLIYSIKAYRISISIFPLLLIISMILVLFIKNTLKKIEDESVEKTVR